MKATWPLVKEQMLIGRLIGLETKLVKLRSELEPEYTDSHYQRIADLRNEYSDIDEIISALAGDWK